MYSPVDENQQKWPNTRVLLDQIVQHTLPMDYKGLM